MAGASPASNSTAIILVTNFLTPWSSNSIVVRSEFDSVTNPTPYCACFTHCDCRKTCIVCPPYETRKALSTVASTWDVVSSTDLPKQKAITFLGVHLLNILDVRNALERQGDSAANQLSRVHTETYIACIHEPISITIIPQSGRFGGLTPPVVARHTRDFELLRVDNRRGHHGRASRTTNTGNRASRTTPELTDPQGEAVNPAPRAPMIIRSASLSSATRRISSRGLPCRST